MEDVINKKAYLYSRCSTLRQEDGDSLDRQKIIGDKFIKDHGLELADAIEDIGKSSFHGVNREENSGLSIFLNACRGTDRKIKEGSTLVIEKIDRLSRQGINEGQKLLLELVELKINLGICEFNTIVEYKNDNNITATMQISNALWMAKKES
ncbi:MAG: DNA invertase Pin-like site-specific DNA recombinase, partial [Oleiphilaceae bacterium]